MAETTSYPPVGGAATDGHATTPAAIAIAWFVVILPAAWGITQTLKQATLLFKNSPAATTPAAASGAIPAPISAPTLGPAPTTTTTPTTR
jgi:hypothetical protein